MREPIYAIGDIHGQADMFDAALDKIARDSGGARYPVVLLGDLIDRGPDSRGVIERVLRGVGEGNPWIVLKGNHDRFLTRFLAAPEVPEARPRGGIHWLDPRLGGRATLASYGVDTDARRSLRDIHSDAVAAIPAEHVALIDAMALMHRSAEAVFVHAGIRPGVPLDQQSEDDLLWIRQEFHNDPRDHGVLVIHGHTPVPAPRHYGNRVNLDTGAGHGQALTAAVIEGRDVFVLTRRGRIALSPDP